MGSIVTLSSMSRRALLSTGDNGPTIVGQSVSLGENLIQEIDTTGVQPFQLVSGYNKYTLELKNVGTLNANTQRNYQFEFGEGWLGSFNDPKCISVHWKNVANQTGLANISISAIDYGAVPQTFRIQFRNLTVNPWTPGDPLDVTLIVI